MRTRILATAAMFASATAATLLVMRLVPPPLGAVVASIIVVAIGLVLIGTAPPAPGRSATLRELGPAGGPSAEELRNADG